MDRGKTLGAKAACLLLAFVFFLGSFYPALTLQVRAQERSSAFPADATYVRTANELVTALKDKTVTYIVFENDIDLLDATNYAARTTNVVTLATTRSSTTLVIDGNGYQLTEKNYDGIRTDYPHLSRNLTWENSGTLQEIVVKNMTIKGYSSYGTIQVPVAGKTRIITYENVVYSGPQPIYNPSGTVNITDSYFEHVWRSKYNTVDQGEIGGEAGRVVLGGNVTFINYDRKDGPGEKTTASSQDEVFWMQKHNTRQAYEIRLLEGANVTVDIQTGGGDVKASGFAYWDLNGSLVLEDNATLDYRSNWGSFNMYHPMDLTIQSGAELNIHTTGRSYSYNWAGVTLLSLTMEPGSVYHHIAEGLYDGNVGKPHASSHVGYPVVKLFPYYRERAEGLVNIDNAASVFWYNDSGPVLKVQDLYYANVDMAMIEAAYWDDAASVEILRDGVNGTGARWDESSDIKDFSLPKLLLGDGSAEADQLWTNNPEEESWSQDDSFEVHGTLRYGTKLTNQNNYYYAASKQPGGYQSWNTAGYIGDAEYDAALLNESTFSPYDKQVFALNGIPGGEMTEVRVNYYLVDENGGVSLDETVARRARVEAGATLTVTPNPDKYIRMIENEDGVAVPDPGRDNPLYLFEMERSNTANAGFGTGLEEESGAVTVDVSRVYGEDEIPQVDYYYALDDNDNGIPDYKEEVAGMVKYHTFVDETGVLSTSGIVNQGTSVDFAGERGRFESATWQSYEGLSYIYDEELTMALHGDGGMRPRPGIEFTSDEATVAADFVFGEHYDVSFVFALDADDNGTPDYKEAKTQEQYARLDGRGRLLASDPVAGPVHTGTYGTEGSITLTDELKTRYEAAEGKGPNHYIFDVEMTLARNVVEGLAIDEDGVAFLYGVNESFTLFYALDENGDGKPDYKGSYATEYQIYLDDKGQEVLVRENTPKPINAGGFFAVPDAKKALTREVEGTTVTENYAFDKVASAQINGGRSLPDGSVWIPDEQGDISYWFVYGLDVDDNGTPGWRESKTYEYHVKLDGEGRSAESIDANTYTGTYGDEMKGRLYPTMYVDTFDPQNNYVLDMEATLANNLMEELTIEDVWVTFRLGVVPAYTVYYALDADGNGIPDYKQGYATGLNVYLDENGDVVQGVWDEPLRVTLNDGASTRVDYPAGKQQGGEKYTFDAEASAALNEGTGVVVNTDQNKLEIPAGSDGLTFYLVYALDGNGDEIPDHKQYFARGTHILLDDKGRVTETAPQPKQLIGDTGLELPLDAALYEERNCILDVETTTRMNAAEGHTMNGNSISIAAGRNAEYYVVYALDEDEDPGIPDHKAKYLTGQYSFYDEEGRHVPGLARQLAPVQLPTGGKAIVVDPATQDLFKTPGELSTNYVFDLAKTMELNEDHTLVWNGGALTITVAGGAHATYTVAYALDADGNGKPDYQQIDIAEYYTLLDATGQPENGGARYLVETHSGLEGESGEQDVAPPTGYAFDYDQTAALNREAILADVLSISGDAQSGFVVEYIFGEAGGYTLQSFVLVYAADADDDGKPDYQNAETVEHHIWLDGSGQKMDEPYSRTHNGIYGETGTAPILVDEYESGVPSENYTIDWAATLAMNAVPGLAVDRAAELVTFQYGLVHDFYIYYALDEDDDGTPDYQYGKLTEFHVLLDENGTPQELEIGTSNRVAGGNTITAAGYSGYVYDVEATEALNAGKADITVTSTGLTVAPGTDDLQVYLVFGEDKDDEGTPDYKQGRYTRNRLVFDGDGNAIPALTESETKLIPGIGLVESYPDGIDEPGGRYVFDEEMAKGLNEASVIDAHFDLASGTVTIPAGTTGAVEYTLPYGLDTDGDGTPDYRQYKATGTRYLTGADGESIVERSSLGTTLIRQDGETVLADGTPEVRDNVKYAFDELGTKAHAGNAAALAAGLVVDENGARLPAGTSSDISYVLVYGLDTDGDGTPDYRQNRAKGKILLMNDGTGEVARFESAQMIPGTGLDIPVQSTYSYGGNTYALEAVLVTPDQSLWNESDGEIQIPNADTEVTYTLTYALDTDGDGTPDYKQHSLYGKAYLLDGDGEALDFERDLGSMLIRTDEALVIPIDAMASYQGRQYALDLGATTLTGTGADKAGFETRDGGTVLVIQPDAGGNVNMALYYALDTDGDKTPDYKQRKALGTAVLWDGEGDELESLQLASRLLSPKADTQIDAGTYRYGGQSYVFIEEESSVEAGLAAINAQGVLIDKDTATDVAYTFVYALDSDGDGNPDYKEDRKITVRWIGTNENTERVFATEVYYGQKGEPLTVRAADHAPGSGWTLDGEDALTLTFGVDTGADFYFRYAGGTGHQVLDMQEYALLLDETGTAEGAPSLVKTHTGEVASTGQTMANAPNGYVYDHEATLAANQMAGIEIGPNGAIGFTFGLYPSFVIVYALDADGEGTPDYKQASTVVYHGYLDGDGALVERVPAETVEGTYGEVASRQAGSDRAGYVYDYAKTSTQNAVEGITVNGDEVHFTLGLNNEVTIWFALDELGGEEGGGDGKPDYQQNKAVRFTVWLDGEGQQGEAVEQAVEIIDDTAGHTYTAASPVDKNGSNYVFDEEASAALNGGWQAGDTITIPAGTESAVYTIVYALDEQGGGGDGNEGDGKPDYKQRFAHGYEVLLDENGLAAEVKPLGKTAIPGEGLTIGYGDAVDKYAAGQYMIDDKATGALNRYLGNVVDGGQRSIYVPYEAEREYYIVYALDADGNKIPDYREVELAAEWIKVDDGETVADTHTYIGEMGEAYVIDSADKNLGEAWLLDETRSQTIDGKRSVTFGAVAVICFYYDKDDSGSGSSSSGGGSGSGSSSSGGGSGSGSSSSGGGSGSGSSSSDGGSGSGSSSSGGGLGSGSSSSDGGSSSTGGESSDTNEGGGGEESQGGGGETTTSRGGTSSRPTASSSAVSSSAVSSSRPASSSSGAGNSSSASSVSGTASDGENGQGGASSATGGTGTPGSSGSEDPGKTPPPGINKVGPGDENVGGTGEPGDVIVVTWPDGSTSTGVVGDDGRWSVVVPDGMDLKAGTVVSAVATGDGLRPSDPAYATVTGENGEGMVRLFDTEIPLGSLGSFNTWSLLNLMLAILALLMGAVQLARHLVLRARKRSAPLMGWIVAAVSLLPVIFFLFIEDSTAQVALLNRWTPFFLVLFGVYAIVYIAHLIFGGRRRQETDV